MKIVHSVCHLLVGMENIICEINLGHFTLANTLASKACFSSVSFRESEPFSMNYEKFLVDRNYARFHEEMPKILTENCQKCLPENKDYISIQQPNENNMK